MQILGPETPKRKEATFRSTQDTPNRMTPSPIGKVWLKAILELKGDVAASLSQFASICCRMNYIAYVPMSMKEQVFFEALQRP